MTKQRGIFCMQSLYFLCLCGMTSHRSKRHSSAILWREGRVCPPCLSSHYAIRPSCVTYYRPGSPHTEDVHDESRIVSMAAVGRAGEDGQEYKVDDVPVRWSHVRPGREKVKRRLWFPPPWVCPLLGGMCGWGAGAEAKGGGCIGSREEGRRKGGWGGKIIKKEWFPSD